MRTDMVRVMVDPQIGIRVERNGDNFGLVVDFHGEEVENLADVPNISPRALRELRDGINELLHDGQ